MYRGGVGLVSGVRSGEVEGEREMEGLQVVLRSCRAKHDTVCWAEPARWAEVVIHA